MKHAYLIIAHNEFEVLKYLLQAIDDVRNDIFVHVDRKVRVLPRLSVRNSNLYVLEHRLDVRWGHVSQIQTELLLFETALKKGPYDYYHLISGTHLPLKSQDEIHSFFDSHRGVSLFSNLTRCNKDYFEILKIHRINLFLRGYSSDNKAVASVCQFLWKSFIAVQRWLKITIYNELTCFWANNWCSLTHDAVFYLVNRNNQILRRYRWSFCGDEYFVPTELMASELSDKVLREDRLLFGKIGKSNADVLTMSDFDDMMASECLFARKFVSNEKLLIDKVLHI